MGKTKIRLFGMDSEPGIFDVEAVKEGETFKITSMRKIGEWR